MKQYSEMGLNWTCRRNCDISFCVIFNRYYQSFIFFIFGRETCSDSILLEPFRVFANFLGSWVVRRLVGQHACNVFCVTIVWMVFGGFAGFRSMSGAGGIACGLPYGSGILPGGLGDLGIKGLANQDFRKSRLFALDHFFQMDFVHFCWYQVSFYLWWIKLLLKSCNFPKSFVRICLNIFNFSFALCVFDND